MFLFFVYGYNIVHFCSLRYAVFLTDILLWYTMGTWPKSLFVRGFRDLVEKNISIDLWNIR
ncbi:MAG: hypothetical protein A2845_05435 [Candidatus Lloydbacteria bacterium RIFCSPHIGHO2_01_FULL_49_22]|uniref:Uncharacterized protein n=1 Tax=Candidatus Lloydbacteria bacterium RIFCSPHIGHO2_01_FULL_49_22 TaxID=1798658 RepID=A0A1G2CTI3_9BACT|nr:MAG: hypothetical protein A2845_05435 [Candidatus Lloydbacteria bacterium RIFCSPHIGHO2_01_FULL_49_22]OGZ09136.1 MAG: hypothetical protein A3C14_04080 [Candidatus Lloydbacteria bacterium RIFCSPHIGHO2_02_FULL_50_18]